MSQFNVEINALVEGKWREFRRDLCVANQMLLFVKNIEGSLGLLLACYKRKKAHTFQSWLKLACNNPLM